jgi:hypothetical protein
MRQSAASAVHGGQDHDLRPHRSRSLLAVRTSRLVWHPDGKRLMVSCGVAEEGQNVLSSIGWRVITSAPRLSRRSGTTAVR